MVTIFPAEPQEVTSLECPACKQRVARIKLCKDSVIEGLTFKCKRCGRLWGVRAEKVNSTEPRSIEIEP
jgi:predicted RNA-binding Zn-ribbon protein involved in translation (DUF1610 family)